VHLLRGNIDTIKKNTETLIDSRKEVGLDVKIGSRCFEYVAQFRYFRRTITNQHLIQEEIKRRLNSDNACYHSVQNLLSSCLLSKNIKILIYKTIILPVLYGCGTWSLTLQEAHRLD
jgi:hypothetical protein